ncbi:non-ribosomal peptide synthetase [Tsukamurella sp. 1534]|uniref:non-ribosomal peptide synthetase n=1 Tax=Tsukamurella sp. 1534 TaxID=1151061 RepID=UPI0002FC7B34|nr:non-ribosomal peptide synthetase [Tsukamurella sp. 1534]
MDSGTTPTSSDHKGNAISTIDSGTGSAQATSLNAAAQDLWLGHHAAARPAVYTTAEAAYLGGHADAALLAEATRRALDESGLARVRFAEERGAPVRTADPDAVALVDRTTVADADAARRLFHRAAGETLDPAGERLMGALVVDIEDPSGPRTAWCLWAHHLVLDGYGYALIRRRIGQLYAALAAGSEPPRSRLITPEALPAPETSGEPDGPPEVPRPLSSWSEGDAPATVGPLHAGRTVDVGTVPTPWAPWTVAAIAAYTARLTGARDVTVGVPVLGRSSTTMSSPLSAAWIAALPLTVAPEATPAALAVAAESGLRAVAAGAHHRTGAGVLVNVKPFSSTLPIPGGTPEFDVLAEGPIADVSITVESLHTDAGPRLRIDLAANPDVYTAPEVAGHADRLADFATAFFADPDVPVGAIDWFTEDDARAWASATGGRTLVDAFDERAAETPDAPAVLAPDGSAVSYERLRADSENLAVRLRDAGVVTGDLVQISVPRGPEVVTAILGVLRAGAAYLPVDPGTPSARADFIVSDAGPTAVVREGGAVAPLTSNPDAARVPPGTAYVIYTSGSTGTPKGVPIGHRNVLRLFTATAMRFKPSDRWIMFHSYAFDFAVWELWGALLHGGAVVVPSRDDVTDPARVAGLVERHGVTVLNQTPAAFYALQHELSGAAAERLRYIVFGGERLEPARLRPWFDRVGDHVTGSGPALVNMYGITETTVHVTEHVLRETDGPASIIGRPLSDLRTYVLDDARDPVPPGRIGEMYVAGPGLSAGYLGRADLTAERFVPDPFGDGRMYRTGDRARITPGGLLEYVGRTDDQVQLRGHRIEPAEIDAAAIDHPDVAGAVTVLTPLPSGDEGLVTYVLAPAGAEAAVHAHLGARLPGYMVPALVIPLTAFPLTVNGKVDKRALPAPSFGAAGAGDPHATGLLADVCAAFADVTGVDAVHPDAGFFALGGHSLLAVRLVRRLAELPGLEAVRLADVFASPTPRAIAALSDGTAGTAAGPAAGPVAGSAGTDPTPLSPAQERLWLLSRLEGADAYLLGLVLRPSDGSALDVDAAVAALGDVARRQESLRTRFPVIDGAPVQEVLTWSPRPTAVDDVRAAVAEALERGFDLATAPPVRTFAAPEGIGVAMHHIIGDESSRQRFTEEFRRAYAARRADDRPEDWPADAPTYRDVTLWRREGAGGEETERDIEFWCGALADAPTEPAWRTDFPRPALPSGAGSVVRRSLGATEHRRLRTVAEDADASVFMALHAALAVTLRCFGAGDDLCLGTPVAGRDHPSTDPLIGCFVNTVVLRTHLGDAVSFEDVLAHVRERDLGAFAHSGTPFDAVVDAVNPPRASGRHPLFQVMLSHWADSPTDAAMTPELVGTDTAKFDLSFRCVETADENGAAGVAIDLEYSTELFTSSTARRLLDRFLLALADLPAAPTAPLASVDLLTTAERDDLRAWSHPTHDEPAREFSEVFLPVARADLGAEALVCGGTRFTYGGVLAWTDALGAHLVSLGVGLGDVVGIALPRGAEMIAAVVAVLRAGAAYVPLDPSYPEDRLADMIDDAAPKVILGDPAFVAAFAPGGALAGTGNGASVESLRRQAPSPDDLAYLIYTSGSTGRPKGVEVAHRGIADLLVLQRDVIGMGPHTRALHFSSISFDLGFWQMMWGLCSGGALVVAREDDRLPGRPLLDVIEAERVNFVGVPPSFAAAFPPDADLAPGIDLMLGAEKLTPSLIARFAPGRRLFNAYGPTECTVNATLATIPPEHTGPVPIGPPDPGMRGYVLDEDLRPVPPGTVGELYLGGPSVALGYRNRPDQTAERFLDDPFVSGGRMYRTSDLVWWGEDGQLYFGGRADSQVKVRGFRIELGEIESVIGADESVADVAVAVLGERIVAYVTTVVGVSFDADSLTRRARSRLPQYMVPAIFVPLPEFPRLPNGKVDLKSLPEPASAHKISGRGPRTPREERVCAMFARALGLDAVGIDDNFFDLGGHSLLAARLMTEIGAEFGVTATVATLFAAPTVGELVARLESGAGEEDSGLGPVLPFRTKGDGAPVFCFHPAGGISWGYAGLLRHLDESFPLYGIQASNLATGARPPGTLREMALEYLERMREVAPHGPYHLVGWSLGGVVAHAIAAELQAAGEPVGVVAMLDSFPSDAWPSVPTEQDALAALLYMVGYDPQPLVDKGITRQAVIDVLQSEGSALAGITEVTPNAMIDNFANAVNLEAEPYQAVVDGDLVFFTAARDPATSATYPLWRPYFTGAIANHDVDCEHKDMTQPGPIAEIGRTLNSALLRAEERNTGDAERY